MWKPVGWDVRQDGDSMSTIREQAAGRGQPRDKLGTGRQPLGRHGDAGTGRKGETEIRGQRSEIRGQKSDDGGQMTDDR